jgi:hypothetical protein
MVMIVRSMSKKTRAGGCMSSRMAYAESKLEKIDAVRSIWTLLL